MLKGARHGQQYAWAAKVREYEQHLKMKRRQKQQRGGLTATPAATTTTTTIRKGPTKAQGGRVDVDLETI